MSGDRPKDQILEVTKAPLAGYTFPNLLGLLKKNRYDHRYILRILYCMFMSITTFPFYFMERIRYDKKIESTQIKSDPIIIIGHWRSGTTYLHKLLSLNKRLGYFSALNAYVAGLFLGSERLFRPVLVYSLPGKRPMDNVLMGVDQPEEDEHAVGAHSPYSYFHGWCFPKNMEIFNRFVGMEGVPKDVIKEWKEIYLYLIKKVTLYNNGKKLVLKNPANTARIKLLLEMFPNSKFIFIYRNPYHVYFSMMKFMKIVIPLFCVQKPPDSEIIERSMMKLYTFMFRKYLEEKRMIPEGNLVELRYEDLMTQPFKAVERIHMELNLGGLSESEDALKKYIESQASFRTDEYEMENTIKEKIYREWEFVFKKFDYQK